MWVSKAAGLGVVARIAENLWALKGLLLGEPQKCDNDPEPTNAAKYTLGT